MKQRHTAVILTVLVGLLLSSIVLVTIMNREPSSSTTPRYTCTVVNAYPHDRNAFTEGLVIADGVLYESTGLYGSSTLRRVDLETGNVLQEVALPNQFFGEGITIINDTIIQLTYQEHMGFIYDKYSLSLLSNFSYSTEGWGITFDGNRLIMSDGTDNLIFLDPATHQNIGHVAVHDGNISVSELNELEYVKGDVYANIWTQQKIAIINPETGQVKAWINLTQLENSWALYAENVSNGIAYDAKNDRLFVTGKNWPQLFEIKLVPSN
jgi:glutamine cyclotransferase